MYFKLYGHYTIEKLCKYINVDNLLCRRKSRHGPNPNELHTWVETDARSDFWLWYSLRLTTAGQSWCKWNTIKILKGDERQIRHWPLLFPVKFPVSSHTLICWQKQYPLSAPWFLVSKKGFHSAWVQRCGDTCVKFSWADSKYWNVSKVNYVRRFACQLNFIYIQNRHILELASGGEYYPKDRQTDREYKLIKTKLGSSGSWSSEEFSDQKGQFETIQISTEGVW